MNWNLFKTLCAPQHTNDVSEAVGISHAPIIGLQKHDSKRGYTFDCFYRLYMCMEKRNAYITWRRHRAEHVYSFFVSSFLCSFSTFHFEGSRKLKLFQTFFLWFNPMQKVYFGKFPKIHVY